MLIAAKLALGFASTIVFAGVYTFREGVIRVDVDEHHSGGSHVHFWVPAAAVPLAMPFVPTRRGPNLPPDAAECLPLVQIVATELSHCPDTPFVDVQDDNERVRVVTL